MSERAETTTDGIRVPLTGWRQWALYSVVLVALGGIAIALWNLPVISGVVPA